MKNKDQKSNNTQVRREDEIVTNSDSYKNNQPLPQPKDFEEIEY